MKIVVVGLLSDQFNRVKRKAGDKHELVHANLADNSDARVRDILAVGDVTVVNTKFISHKAFSHVDRSRCVMVRGGESAVVRAIKQLETV